MSFYLSATATPEYFDDPELTEGELLHEFTLDEDDRGFRHAPIQRPYVEAPSDRERAAHRSHRLANSPDAADTARGVTTHGGLHE